MPTHPSAPDLSSPELKTRAANFMRRANAILRHPLADHTPGIQVTFTLDADGNPISGIMNHQNVPVEPLVFLATQMRPIIFLQNDPISLKKLISRIEAEHPAFRGKFAPLRDGFNRWLREPIVASMTVGEVPPHLQTDTPQLMALASAPVGTASPEGVEISEMTSDLYYAQLYFNGEHWHSDVDKAAEYEAASEHQKAFIAKCAELRTFHAIPFIRSLHDWMTQVRERGMDI